MNFEYSVDIPGYLGDDNFEFGIHVLGEDRAQNEMINLSNLSSDMGYDAEDMFKNLFNDTELEELEFTLDNLIAGKSVLSILNQKPMSSDLIPQNTIQKEKKRRSPDIDNEVASSEHWISEVL